MYWSASPRPATQRCVSDSRQRRRQCSGPAVSDEYRKPALWCWAGGSLATGTLFNAMSLFALFYMTSVLGIGPALAGSLLFFIRLYDAVTDPLMGALSDRTRHRLGPQRLYLLIGALALPASFALFFNLPPLQGGYMTVWLVAALLLYSTSYTIFAVPYLAMPPKLAPSYDARTALMSKRVSFLIIGVLIGSAGGPLLVEAAGDNAAGYSALGFGLGSLALVAGLIAFFGTKPRRLTSAGQAFGDGAAQALQWRHAFVQAAAIFKHAPFRLLTIVKLLQLAVLALVLTCTPFFFRYVLERSTAEITYYLGVFSVAGLLSMPLWRWVIKRHGKRETYIVSIVLYGLGMVSWFLWQAGEAAPLFYARAVLLGIFSNGTLLCALSMLPDTMEYDRLASNENREGIMSGIFTTVEKISGALGPLIFGVLLEATGFQAGAGLVAQPASAILAVKLGLSLIPALLCFACVPFLLAYRLGPAEFQAMRRAQEAAA